MEIWKDVEEFEGLYEVSNLGNVRRKYKTVNRKLCANSTGYLLVVLCKGAKNHSHSVHRLVAKAFVHNPLNKSIVNHIDGNKLNNKASNLEWVSQYENIQHSIKQGLNPKVFKKGSNHINSKLNDQLAREIYDLAINRIYSQEKIGELYGVSQVNVKEIKFKRTWKHIHSK